MNSSLAVATEGEPVSKKHYKQKQNPSSVLLPLGT